MKKYILTLLLLVTFSQMNLVWAQSTSHRKSNASRAEMIVRKYLDTLSVLHDKYAHWTYVENDTLNNPYYFSLFTGTTLYSNVLHRTLGSLSQKAAGSLAEQRREKIDLSLLRMYAEAPFLITSDESILKTGEGIRNELNSPVRPDIQLSKKNPEARRPTETLPGTDINIVAHRPNFWKFNTDLSLQFMQNYISDNWYKGGESNNSMFGSMSIEANYNNKSKLMFNNRLELKLGFLSSRSDSIHKYKTNQDLIRMTNKLGLQATKSWYYTLMLQSWTQFYRSYKSNNTKVYSDFMSPFEALLSLGMDYKLEKKNIKLSATISPFACNFKYVGRNSLIETFGLRSGHHTKFEYGSNITVNLRWTVMQNCTWQSRLYYYTDYSKTQIEWENTLNLQINKILSTQFFLYPRFDDSASRGSNNTYLQFKEYLAFGFNISL